MRLSRFERKIVLAMALVALAPLIGALLLGRSTLSDVYAVGVNDQVRGQLEQGVSLYRDHLETLRSEAERTADAIAFHAELRRGVQGEGELEGFLDRCLQRYPLIARIAVRTPTQSWERGLSSRRDEERWTPLTLERWLKLEDGQLQGEFGVEPPETEPEEEIDDPYAEPTVEEEQARREVPEGYVLLEVDANAPAALFDAFQRAGEQAELFSRLEEEANYVSEAFLYLYTGGLALLIAVALAFGVFFSRRVTARVVDLANATQRVGAGDLTVQVPTSGSDEVMELTESFNTMVRDLRETRARVEYLQRIGAWQEFARRLAHEIKNPLTPIQLATQEIHRSYGGGDPQFEQKLDDARAIIEEEIATLRRLVSEFSSFAKLPAATLSEADLREFLSDVERSVPAILEDAWDDSAQTPKVEVELEGDPLLVRVDAMMLKRCLDNLIRNAVQALRKRGGRVRVHAQLVDAKWVELIVEDDGPGIEESHRARVFDPYFTTKSDGTGLGLAIVKKVVLEHQGEITCEASDEGGARFVMRLPRGKP